MTNLRPIVPYGVREDLTVVIEGAFGKWLVQHLRRLEPGTRILVPEGEGTVRSHGRQCPVCWVERNVVYGVDILRVENR